MKRFAFFLMVWTAGAAYAAPAFRTEQNLPTLGLRIRILSNASPDPLPPHHTFPYTFTRGETSERVNLYDPRELWYATQHAGQWVDDDRNVLILARPTHRVPVIASDLPHVTREAFEEALARPESAIDPTSPAALAEWVAVFAGTVAGPPEPLRQPATGIARALYVPLKDASSIAFIFQINQRQPDGRFAPSPWFAALVRVGDGTAKDKVRRDMESQFLANASSIPVAGAGSVGGVRTRDLSSAAAPLNLTENPSRVAARKSIANMKDWWYAEAHGYIFLSDIKGSTGRILIRDLQAGLPALRAAFASLVPPIEPSEDVSVVRIFEDAAAYKQYVGSDIEWSIGAWMPMRRELVVLAQDKDREKTLEIIQHEGFHQYLSLSSGSREHAMWFNEGHACFFEGARIDRNGRVELPETDRVNHLLANLDTASRMLPSLLRASREGFYNGTDGQRSLHYSTAWALVYFLQTGAPATLQTKYAKVLPNYLKEMAGHGEAEKATAAAFADIDMAQLQKDFTDFWKRGRTAARRFDPLKP